MDADGDGDGGEERKQGREKGGFASELAPDPPSPEHHSLERDVEAHVLIQLRLSSKTANSIGLNFELVLLQLLLPLLQVQLEYRVALNFHPPVSRQLMFVQKC